MRNLPPQHTSFIGRERELVELTALAQATQLLTLTGPGGSGKTRLATTLCTTIAEDAVGEAWFVDLSSVTDPGLVPSVVASALGCPASSEDVAAALVSSLAMTRCLILLDNCEQVLTACTDLVSALLSHCPEVRIVATSRQALDVTGETVWIVPGMSTPDHVGDPQELGTYDAVRLFTDRAKMVSHSFELSTTNARGVVRLIERLDGIPLALELAAAWTRMLTPEQIADHLDDRFRLLTRGKADAPPRHQTLRAAMDWSYELLHDRARHLLALLSIFRGGFTLEAAGIVYPDEPPGSIEALETLHALVESSLVVVDTSGEEARYSLLETIREYAAEKRSELPDDESIRHRHLTWYARFTREGLLAYGGDQERQWLERFDADVDNIREALHWSLDGGDAVVGLRVAASMAGYWMSRSQYAEGRTWLTQLLDREASSRRHDRRTAEETKARAKALYVLCQMTSGMDSWDGVRPALEESIALLREIQDDETLGTVLSGLAGVQRAEGRLAESLRTYEEALEIIRRHGDRSNEGRTLTQLGEVRATIGDYPGARLAVESAVDVLTEAGDVSGLVRASVGAGDICLMASELSDARRWFERALAQAREVERADLVAYTLYGLGKTAQNENDHIQAASFTERAMAQYLEIGLNDLAAEMQGRLGRLAFLTGALDSAVSWYERALELAPDRVGAAALEGIAEVAEGAGDVTRGATLLGASSIVREMTGVRPDAEETEVIARTTAKLLEAMGETAFDRAWADGRVMTFAQAVATGIALRTSLEDIPAAGQASVRADGEVWIVSFEGRTVRMQDSKGMQHLATLVASPGREIHVLDLVAGPGGPADATRTGDLAGVRGTDAGEMLDAEARASYEQRLRDLQEEIEEAAAFSDDTRASGLRQEFDAVVGELKRATGLGGRPRKAASDTERARLNVQRTIKAAIKRIFDADRAIGRHLDDHVKTGTYCSYSP